MSQIVGASFLYEKTWTVLFIIYFQLYSLVVTDISKHVNDIKMHFTVFTKKLKSKDGVVQKNQRGMLCGGLCLCVDAGAVGKVRKGKKDGQGLFLQDEQKGGRPLVTVNRAMPCRFLNLLML